MGKVSDLTSNPSLSTDDLLMVVDVSTSTSYKTSIGDILSLNVPVITSTTSSATPTPDGSKTLNFYIITALAVAAEFAVPSGLAEQGSRLMIRIKDDGTARVLSWNAIYRVMGVTLPTTTVLGKTTYLFAIYNSTDSKWDVLAVGQEV